MWRGMVNFIAAIGKILVRPGPSQQTLQHLTEAIVEHLDAALTRVWTLDATTDTLVLQATAGGAVLPDEPQDRIAVGDRGVGRIAAEMRPQVTNAAMNDAQVGSRSWIMRQGITAFAGFPLIVERRLVGVFAVYLTHPITEELQAALAAIADDIAIAVDYRRVQAELEAAREAAKEAEKNKQQFLANISHEIRTPLSAIIGVNTLLADTLLTKEQRQYAEIVRISSDALLSLINNMLDWSNVESGAVELDKDAFDLHACIEETIDLLAPQASRKHLELTYSIDSNTPRRIYGDATRLRQVITNLLANAIRFTRVGDVNVSVITRAREQGLVEIKIAIRDTGIGIAAERLERMFNPFGQTDAATTRKFGGTHLGLAICKRLCEVMNATIDVVSELDKGSTFTVVLLARAAASEPQPHTRTSQPHLAGRRVLVVDDNDTSRSIVSEHLRSWGMVPIEASSAADALTKFNDDTPFDLALIDMHMPGMTGPELVALLPTASAESNPMPVVLLSSLFDQSHTGEIVTVTSILSKPIKPSHLYNTVLEALSVSAPRVNMPPRVVSPSVAPIADRLPLRILVAEDYIINQQVAVLMLERLGYRCDVVGNGLEAVTALRRGHHDVVLMDMHMPEMDGFEASRVIWREWEPEERPYIVAMTANAMPGDRERCLASGMDAYLAKPVRVDELRHALEEAASRLARRRKIAPPQHLKIFDPGPIAQLRQLGTLGDEAIANEIVQAFCIDTPGRIATLRAAVEAKDLKQVELIAHSLKSGSGTVGARQLATLFAAIESKAESGDHAAVVALADDLERTFADARIALESAMRTSDQPS